jgi:hypothetical protein
MFWINFIPASLVALILVFLLPNNVQLITLMIALIALLSWTYQIRYYPSTIIVSQDSICIDYFNKGIFKQTPIQCDRTAISIVRKNKKNILYCHNNIVAIITSRSIFEEDKQVLYDILLVSFQDCN